jgi:hypothetical protein
LSVVTEDTRSTLAGFDCLDPLPRWVDAVVAAAAAADGVTGLKATPS